MVKNGLKINLEKKTTGLNNVNLLLPNTCIFFIYNISVFNQNDVRLILRFLFSYVIKIIIDFQAFMALFQVGEMLKRCRASQKNKKMED